MRNTVISIANEKLFHGRLKQFVDFVVAFVLLIPVLHTLWKVEIVKTIGYSIFAVGSVAPDIYERIVKQILPTSLKLSMRFSVVLHSIFGQFLDFYEKFPFWDELLHFYGSMVITFFFFCTISRKSKFWDVQDKGRILLSFLLGVFSGVLWEIAEFITDKLFAYTTQHSLDDTMCDLIVDCLGAYLVAKILYKKTQGRFFWHPRKQVGK